MIPFWLSLDSDDLLHLPKNRGHPTRSETPMPHWRCKPEKSSDRLLAGFDLLSNWLDESGCAVTIFCIAEQLDCREFVTALSRLLARPNVTVANHGWSHRCWSAWPVDLAGFSAMLSASMARLEEFAGVAWRPWFRAPGGYIAPWMATPLAAAGITLDSSVNPSPLLSRKTGRRAPLIAPDHSDGSTGSTSGSTGRDSFRGFGSGFGVGSGKVKEDNLVLGSELSQTKRGGKNGWLEVIDAMRKVGIVERPWSSLRSGLTPALPACGPALHLPLLGRAARRLWRRQTSTRAVTEAELLDSNTEVNSLYWHILDHCRQNGRWTPPIQTTQILSNLSSS